MRAFGIAIVVGVCVVATADVAPDRVARVRAELDAHHTCTDTCCLPALAWFGDGAIDKADVAAARRAVADRDPRVAALAMHVLARAGELADVPALERSLGDARPAGQLPSVSISQAVQRCYAAQWSTTTVEAEALHALSHVFATDFATADDYRSFRKQHADPEATFDYWYAQLRARRPPAAEVLARLRKREPLLVARALAAYCSDDCGDDGALDAALRAVGPERVLSWLLFAETFPEWNEPEQFASAVVNVIRHGDKVFGDAQFARLDGLIDKGSFPPSIVAQIAVLASRIRPREALRVWTRALHALPRDHGAVLAEAAEREPIAFADTLAASFTGDDIVPILGGLARAGTRGSSTFARVVAHHAFSPDDEDGVIALAKAARAAGCTGIADPGTLRRHSLKGGGEADERARAEHARASRAKAIADVALCMKS